MKNGLLETRGTGSLFYKAGKIRLIYILTLYGWQNWQAIEQYLAEVTSEQSSEGVLWNLIIDWSQLGGERMNFREMLGRDDH